MGKKFGKLGLSKNDHEFKIIFQNYLSSKHRIILVNVFDKFLLLGMTDQNINLLKEYSLEEVNKIDFENTSKANHLFAGFLKKTITGST